jgi:redox-sensitive bicupin YhaK (pirin superfamily)
MRYGDVQCMSAGTGVKHSELNRSETEPLRFVQIWIEPDVKGLAPDYEEKHFDLGSKQGRLCLIASPSIREDALCIHQDVLIYASIIRSGDFLTHALAEGRNAYVHLIHGRLMANGEILSAGDALKVCRESVVSFSGLEEAEILLFDLPAYA